MSKRSKKMKANGRSADGVKSPYLILSYGMLNHPNFHHLSGAAVKVLLYIAAKHNGYNNGKIASSSDDMANDLGMSKSTVTRACKDLQYYGFMVLTKRGRFQGRMASEWEVTFLNSAGLQPLHSWKEAVPKLRQRPKKQKKTNLIDEILALPEYKLQVAH